MFWKNQWRNVCKSNNSKDKHFLQDGNSSQNSRKANDAMYKVGAKKFSIPARSPDINLTGNVFNYVRTELYEESFNKNIPFANFEEQVENINKNIDSMDNRLSMVVKKRGKQIKY